MTRYGPKWSSWREIGGWLKRMPEPLSSQSTDRMMVSTASGEWSPADHFQFHSCCSSNQCHEWRTGLLADRMWLPRSDTSCDGHDKNNLRYFSNVTSNSNLTNILLSCTKYTKTAFQLLIRTWYSNSAVLEALKTRRLQSSGTLRLVASEMLAAWIVSLPVKKHAINLEWVSLYFLTSSSTPTVVCLPAFLSRGVSYRPCNGLITGPRITTKCPNRFIYSEIFLGLNKI